MIGDQPLTADQAVDYQAAARAAGELLIWTVTTGTSDHGQRYVARPHRVREGPQPVYLIADTLTALHGLLPPGLDRIPADPADDPVIVETWL